MARPDANKTDFTGAPIGPLFARTALPIVFLMTVSGLFNVVDAIFVGIYVGADALAGVTVMFPIIMMSVALATLVANGMASVMARQLGGGQIDAARASLAGAHGLSVLTCALLVILFLVGGRSVVELAANGPGALADYGYRYLAITIFTAPLAFLLSVQSTALRVEGWIGFMAITGALVTLANIAFNFAFIAGLGWGVSGSAIGSAVAQALGLVAILVFRARGHGELPALRLPWQALRTGWPRFIALGAPQSLAFLGMSLGSATVLLTLQALNVPDYDTTVAAYGIITRLLSFSYLGLMGMAQALQAIVGNNFGAGLYGRVAKTLRVAMLCALAYAAIAEAIFVLAARPLAGLFVTDPAVIDAVGRILPMIVAVYVLAGPSVMISTHFQAMGEAGRAGLLSLSRTYLFAIPLTLALPLVLGETGIWLASPAAEALMLGLTVLTLVHTARARGYRFGLIPTEPKRDTVPTPP